ncbi:FAD-binding oxidoreductase [Gordonia rhizosphera]|uniref:Putative oxidoreductase n=1 Tax=Gordonia rhizosphera NBRC 16068 TaxID=1108045 RepID=K6VUA1_9ACTN|nr:FAD-binding oxidoreductase [Gordonia rhizosphera]GAB90480.1 putative oxidoreductase [Gordonia rhizosphera NBRC 16068]
MTIQSAPRTDLDDDIAVRTRTAVLAALADRIVGDVYGPGDPGYDVSRRGFNVLADHRPAVIVCAVNRFDVVEAVRFAAEEGLRVAILATGHGPGTAADGALLVNTSAMTDVRVDPIERTATVSAGAKWGPVLEQAQQHGLAPLLGSTTDVGVVGYTLGGGFGWLGRKYGLASDSVRSFGVVTPAGEPITASATSHPDIFWALKGGGAGSIGVVTDVVLDLFPVSTVYGGNLFYPAEDAAEVMRRFARWAPEQGEDLTSAVTLMNFPPLEMVPEPLRGKSFVLVRGCWSGDLEVGKAVIDEWRDWKTPAMDMWGEMPFAAADSISMDPTDPMPSMMTTEWCDDLPDEAIDILVSRVLPRLGSTPIILLAELRHSGGAIARGAAEAVNDRGRSGTFLLEMVSVVPDPHVGLAVESALRLTRKALEPYVTGAAYLNFLEGEERVARSASSFSDTNRARVAQIKASLDPDNRFCHGVTLT